MTKAEWFKQVYFTWFVELVWPMTGASSSVEGVDMNNRGDVLGQGVWLSGVVAHVLETITC